MNNDDDTQKNFGNTPGRNADGTAGSDHSAQVTAEARIVAWVAGEASAFEIAELERLVAAQPELAEFKRQMEATQRLVSVAAKPDAEPLRLSAERREKLLAVIGGKAETAPVEERVAAWKPVPSRWSWRSAAPYFSVAGLAAACLAVFLIVTSRETPVFESKAVVQFEKPESIVTSAGVIDNAVHSEVDFNTNVQVLRSRKIRSMVVESLTPEERNKILAPALKKLKPGEPPPTVESQLGAITFEPSRESHKIGIDVRHEDPEAAAIIANKYASEFQRFRTFTIGGTQSDAVAALSERAAVLKKESEAADEKLQRFKVENNLVSVDAAVGQPGSTGGAKGGALRYGGSTATADRRLGAVTFDAENKLTAGGASPGNSQTFNGPVYTGGVVGGSTKRNTAGTTAVVSGTLAINGASPATARTRERPQQVSAAERMIGSVSVTPEIQRSKDIPTAGVGGALAPGVESEIIVMSPFEVKEERTGGYMASSSLAGTRLNTSANELKDQIAALPKMTTEVTGSFSGRAPAKAAKDAAQNATTPLVVAEERASKADTSEGGLYKNRPASDFDGSSSAPVSGVADARPGVPTMYVADTNGSTTVSVGGQPPVELTKRDRVEFRAARTNDDVIQLQAFTVANEADKSRARGGASSLRGETATAVEPVSTFSLHVSDASFRLAQAALAAAARGETPDYSSESVRAEEFYNAFDYGDPAPSGAEKIAARIEQAAHPFHQQRNFVRIAVKVGASGRVAGRPLRLTVLLDTSGSMEREDRRTAVRRALQELVTLLGAQDRLTLVGFARTPRLLAEDVAGDKAGAVVALAERTPAEGGTNIEEALKLAGELARRHRDPAAQNRIVLLTDGAANLGDADPARLTAMVVALRQQGVAFDACGVGLEGNGDANLEALTRQGDGRYYVLGAEETADASFAKKLAGAFRPAAENVKVQVRFNPARVGHYRLIGFEQHRLKTEDFRNDAVDAAELAADEAAVALYEVEPLPQGEGELGEVFVRFRDPASGAMVERSWAMPYDARVPAFDRATPSLQLAGVAALLAERLRDDDEAKQIKLAELAPVVNALRGHYAQQARVQELVTMFAQTRKLSGE